MINSIVSWNVLSSVLTYKKYGMSLQYNVIVVHCCEMCFLCVCQSYFIVPAIAIWYFFSLFRPSVFSCRFQRLSQLPWLPVQRTRSIMRRPGSVWRSWPSTSNLSATPEVQHTQTHACYFCSLLRLYYHLLTLLLPLNETLKVVFKTGSLFLAVPCSLRCENTAASWIVIVVALFPFKKCCMS